MVINANGQRGQPGTAGNGRGSDDGGRGLNGNVVNAVREQPGGLAELVLPPRFFLPVGGMVKGLGETVDEAFGGRDWDAPRSAAAASLGPARWRSGQTRLARAGMASPSPISAASAR